MDLQRSSQRRVRRLDAVVPGQHPSPAERVDIESRKNRHAIGVENILAESDYPHGDGTWPDTQAVLAKLLAGVPDEEARMITHRNAAELYRHPLPSVCVP